MAHAREEYLFQYSIYVLESSTSSRLTYFMPPLNLIPLTLLRPLRLFLPSEDVRRIRILVLKATHVPFVALIWAYEKSSRIVSRSRSTLTKAPPFSTRPISANRLSLDARRDLTKPRSTRRALPETSPTRPTVRRSSTTKSTLNSTENVDLVTLIQNLSAQVDSLTTMVAAQQKD
jgi:hypothetical protein